MNHFKAITLLVVAAIANPLCCCLGVDAFWQTLVEQPVEEANSCCMMSMAESGAEKSPVKNHDECPHELERISKIVDGDTSLQVSKPVFLATFCLLSELVAEVEKRDRSIVSAGPPPDLLASTEPPTSEAYCVYIL